MEKNGIYVVINGVLHDLQIIRFVCELCKLVRYEDTHPIDPGKLKKLYVIKLLRSMPNNSYGLKECKELVEWVEGHRAEISAIPYDLVF